MSEKEIIVGVASAPGAPEPGSDWCWPDGVGDLEWKELQALAERAIGQRDREIRRLRREGQAMTQERIVAYRKGERLPFTCLSRKEDGGTCFGAVHALRDISDGEELASRETNFPDPVSMMVKLSDAACCTECGGREAYHNTRPADSMKPGKSCVIQEP